MSLGELIGILEAEPNQEKRITPGFTHPHSYRGDYFELAVEPTESTTVGALLKELQGAVGKTYEGWKGGDFTMNKYSRVWIAEQGDCSDDMLGPIFLRVLLGA